MVEAILISVAVGTASYLSYSFGFKRGKDTGYHIGFTNGLFKGNEQRNRRILVKPSICRESNSIQSRDPVWLG